MIKAESDIVERLRAGVPSHKPNNFDLDLTETAMTEAADEITRLRGQLDKARDALRPFARDLIALQRVVFKKDYYITEGGDLTYSDLVKAAATLKEIDT